MIKYNYLLGLLVAVFFISSTAESNFTGHKNVEITASPIQLGAYYFDGWTGQTPMHTSRALIDSFPEREPVWGWLTSSLKVIHDQINAAANAGLAFFSFCWYYPTNNPGNFNDAPRNHALNLYLKSENKNRLKYCLLVANHSGYFIRPKDWNKVSKA